MRRFEQEEDGTTKFWQIDMRGDTFVATWGKVGSNSKNQRTRKFSSEAEAEKEADKQIREKLAAGFAEIDGDGEAVAPKVEKVEKVEKSEKSKPAATAAAAPVAAKPVKAEKVEKPRPVELPPRHAVREATAESIAAAATALRELESTLGKRSWLVTHRTQRARRALEEIAGFNPSSDRDLGAAFDALMARVVGGAPRLPLRRAMALLEELDAAAFTRALALWQKGSEPPAAARLLADQAELLEHQELALRVGALLVDRPDNEAGWSRRWRTLSPLLEGQLRFLQTTLPRYLDGIDAAGDAHLARRVERMKS